MLKRAGLLFYCLADEAEELCLIEFYYRERHELGRLWPRLAFESTVKPLFMFAPNNK